MVWVDADQTDLDLLSFEVVERHLEAPHRRLIVDPGVPEVEMQRVGRREAHPGVQQAIDGGRAEHTGSPHEPERELRVVDVFDTDPRWSWRAHEKPAGATGDGPGTEAAMSARHVK